MTPAPRSVTVALAQMAMGPDKGRNIEQAARAVGDAARRGAQVVCLPELFATPYFCQVEDPALFELAETVPGPTTEAMAAAARQHGVTVIAPVFEKRAAGIYHNSLVVLGPGGELLGQYRKMHIPDDPLFYEKYYFAPGDLGFVTVATPHAAVGPLICWDQWYPEAARLVALQGAQIICYPTAIGWHPKEKAEFGAAQLEAWRTIQRAHAIANGVFVVAVNRVGHEGPAPGLDFWGHSFVADPFGTVLAEAGEGVETLVVPLDLAKLEDVRHNWPFLRDRRIDAYGGLTSRFLGGPKR